MKRSISTALAPCLACATAAAATDAILIDATLARHEVSIREVGAQGVVYIDHLGLERTAPITDVLAIVWDEASLLTPPMTLSLGVLQLTDGERINGRPAPGDAPPDALVWDDERLGALTVPLERIASVSMPATSPMPLPSPGADDAVVLRNGDVLQGFLVSLSGTRVEIERERVITLPAESVHTVILANPPEAPTGARVWLAGGEILAASSLGESEPGRLRFHPAIAETEGGSATRFSLRSVHAVVPDAARIRSLTSLPLDTRAATRRPELAGEALGSEVRFPGPTSARWELPPGATRFACTVRLPESEWSWGDCTVRVLVDAGEGPRELFATRVRATEPQDECVIDLPGTGAHGRTLTVIVDPGEHGPIQDRPILQHAVLAIDPDLDAR